MKSIDYSKSNWFYLDHTFCIRGIVVETSNTYITCISNKNGKIFNVKNGIFVIIILPIIESDRSIQGKKGSPSLVAN